MTDDFEKLEAELAAMRPRPVSLDLTSRIDGELAPPFLCGDRLLATMSLAGTLAALVIVGLIIAEPAARARPADPQPATVAPAATPSHPTERELMQAFVVARLDESR